MSKRTLGLMFLPLGIALDILYNLRHPTGFAFDALVGLIALIWWLGSKKNSN